jgi:hypothetical protein
LLLVLLIVAIGLCGWSFYSLNLTMQSIQGDIQTALKSNESASQDNNSTAIDMDNTYLQVYSFLYEQLSKYGLQQQYGQQSASLANAILDRTLKNYSIDSIEYLDNGLILHVSGIGLEPDFMNEKMLSSALASAAASYVSNNWQSLLGNALSGNQDAIKENLYEKMAEALFENLEKEVDSQTNTQVSFSLSFILQDGQWVMNEIKDE